MKKIILLSSFLILLFFNSCEEDDKPQIVFSICNFEDFNPMTDAIVEGCRRAINEHELSKEYDIILDHQIYPSDTATFGEEFLKLGNSANFRLIKGMMVKAVNTKKVENIINQVALNGSIVYSFENDVPNSLRYSYFGPDYYEIGRLAAEQCSRLGDTIKKIVFVTSKADLENNKQALQGFVENYNFTNNDNINLVIPLDKKEAQSAINFIALHEDFDCAFIIQTSFFDESYSLPYGFKDKLVITIGGFPSQYKDLINGRIDMIISYNPFVLGNKMMKSLIDLSLLNIEPQANNLVPLTIVDSSNADDWFKIWE